MICLTDMLAADYAPCLLMPRDALPMILLFRCRRAADMLTPLLSLRRRCDFHTLLPPLYTRFTMPAMLILRALCFCRADAGRLYAPFMRC